MAKRVTVKRVTQQATLYRVEKRVFKMRMIFKNFWGLRIIGPRLRHLKLLF
jgi:hypothetical protein